MPVIFGLADRRSSPLSSNLGNETTIPWNRFNSKCLRYRAIRHQTCSRHGSGLPPQYRKCVIYADSQPAIKVSTSPSHQSRQSINCAVLDSVDSLKVQRPNTEISLVWIPSNMDIPGNEKADEMAKEAAKLKGTTGDPFPFNTLRSMRNNVIKQASKNEWDSILKWELRSSHLARIINKVQSYPSSAIYNTINSRWQRVQLARLRTGNCSFNQCLHRFSIEESPLC